MIEFDGAVEENVQYKYIRRWNFFKRGFNISLIIWACGITFSMIGGQLFDLSPVIRLISIFVPLGIYIFFTTGKFITESQMKNVKE